MSKPKMKRTVVARSSETPPEYILTIITSPEIAKRIGEAGVGSLHGTAYDRTQNRYMLIIDERYDAAEVREWILQEAQP